MENLARMDLQRGEEGVEATPGKHGENLKDTFCPIQSPKPNPFWWRQFPTENDRKSEIVSVNSFQREAGASL